MGKKRKIVGLCIVIVSGVVLTAIIFLFSQNYYDPGNSNTPEFSLPIAPTNIYKVTGIQRFNRTLNHTGFDFKLENDTKIVAPIGGKITEINYHEMSNNLWIVDVFLRINPAWGMFIAFEPWTYTESVAIAQKTNISAYIRVGQVVAENQTLGWLLPVNGSEFPHIHWSVFQIPNNNWFVNDGDRVNPYNYCSTAAKSVMDNLCATLWPCIPC